MKDEEFLRTIKDLIDSNYKKHKKVAFYAEKMNVSVHLLNKNLSRIEGKKAKDLINVLGDCRT